MLERTIQHWKREKDDITARVIIWGMLSLFILFGLIPWMIGISKYFEWIFF